MLPVSLLVFLIPTKIRPLKSNISAPKPLVYERDFAKLCCYFVSKFSHRSFEEGVMVEEKLDIFVKKA